MKSKERELNLYKFCNKYIPNFTKENYYKSMNKALKLGLKKHQKLVTINKIDIYKSELDYINSLEINQEYKKVMFTFLVQLKINKIIYEYKYSKEYDSLYFYGGKIKYNNIKNISNIPKTMSLNDEVINTLSNLKLVTILHRGKISLNYIENCIHNEDEEVIFEVNDFENIGLYLDYYNNVKGIIKCENCGKIIRVRNNHQKFCSICWKEHRNNYQKELMRKIRNN